MGLIKALRNQKTMFLGLPIVRDHNFVRNNGIYLCGTDNEKVYIDDFFDDLPWYARLYLLTHAEGCVINNHPHEHKFNYALSNDKYVMSKFGKLFTYRAMSYLIKYFANVDWTVSAEFMVRLNDLGYPKGDRLFIIAPNGLYFNVETLRPYMD